MADKPNYKITVNLIKGPMGQSEKKQVEIHHHTKDFGYIEPTTGHPYHNVINRIANEHPEVKKHRKEGWRLTDVTGSHIKEETSQPKFTTDPDKLDSVAKTYLEGQTKKDA